MSPDKFSTKMFTKIIEFLMLSCVIVKKYDYCIQKIHDIDIANPEMM